MGRLNIPTVEEARSWYEAGDPVHGFGHALRVFYLAVRLGKELGADIEIIKAAALLHDAAGAAPGKGSGRERHELSSAQFAGQVLEAKGWPRQEVEAVLHAIRSHRFRSREAPTTLEAQILFDADKLDVMGAFGIARTIGYALQAGQPIFARPSNSFLKKGEREPGEPHSAYHEYLFKLRHVKDRLYTSAARKVAKKRQALLEAFFEQLAAEARGKDGRISYRPPTF